MNEIDELSRAVARIQTGALALVFAIVGGGGIFLMTAWLLIKGGPHVGPHLQLLSQYFVGYSVSWTGSLVGFVWGAVTGWIVGWAIGRIYNTLAAFRDR